MKAENSAFRQTHQPPIVRRLIRAVALGLIVPSTLGAFGGVHQLLDLCSHFRCQYFVLSAVLAIVLWRAKSFRWASAVLLVCLHNAVLIGPYYMPARFRSASSLHPDGTQISILSFNVHTSNRRGADVLAYLQRRNPDLLLLIEVDHRWIRELSPLDEIYPHRVIAAQDGPFGIALYSKWPITNHELLRSSGSSSAAIWAELSLDQRLIGFLGAHPPPPMTPSMFNTRNEHLAMVARQVRQAGLPTIVAGDFNATPWCVGFQPLRHAGLSDTALGFGVQRTWNAYLPLMRIPIDHVLATKEFVTLRRAIGPNCGSDHYPVEAAVALTD